MISILTHGSQPGDLLAARLATARRPLHVSAGDLGVFGPSSAVVPGAEIYRAGDRRAAPGLVVSGVAAEVRYLDEGRRQILQVRLPGDLIEPRDREVVVAITKARVTDARPFLEGLSREGVSAGLRLAWLQLREEDADRLRDHVVRLGRMTARERVASFLLEIHDRLARAGLVSGQAFHMPLTQEMLSDVLGLSVVHVNRTLKALRSSGLITLNQGFVSFIDRGGLAGVAGVEATAGASAVESVARAAGPRVTAGGA